MLATTKYGAHLGWFEPFSRKRWIRHPISQWFNALLQEDASPKAHPSAPQPPADDVYSQSDFIRDVHDPSIGFRVVAAGDIVEGGIVDDALGSAAAMKGL